MFPLGARPGPPCTIDGSASASSFTAATAPLNSPLTSSYRSSAPFTPLASTEPSACRVSVAPASDFAVSTAIAVHTGASPPGTPAASQS